MIVLHRSLISESWTGAFPHFDGEPKLATAADEGQAFDVVLAINPLASLMAVGEG
jgi:hypothetical protein